MRLPKAEYLLKGVFLGLLLFAALQAGGQPGPAWPVMARVSLCTLGGLVLALAAAAALNIRQGYRVQGKPAAFLLFLFLESPDLIYAGLVLGVAVGAFLVRPEGDRWLVLFAVGGAAVGAALGMVRDLTRLFRLGLSLLIAAALVAGALYWFGEIEQFQPATVFAVPNPTFFSIQLLLGIPFFYLLTFAGREEETEVEIGATCAALGLGLAMLTQQAQGMRVVAFIAPIMIYFWYTTQVLPGLRVFKHVMRAYSYWKIGRLRFAILSFRRAVQLDPNNKLAREGLWGIHRTLDPAQLTGDPEVLAVVDFELCLERAGALLLQPGPTAAQLGEANRLLDLVAGQRPVLKSAVHYWRSVALTHARQFEQAAAELEQVLDRTSYEADDPHRRAILLRAWQLGLNLHPELTRRVGNKQLALPGRRIEAIAAVERQLAETPDDADTWTLKRMLYSELSEDEYEVFAAAAGPAALLGHVTPSEFDHAYAQQLGLALIGDAANWRRGEEYLRMAVRGLPQIGPGLFMLIAQARQKAGDLAGALANYELVKQAGQAVGTKNLSTEERETYYGAVKLLAESAEAREDFAAAVAHYQLYTEYEKSGIETLRTLADLLVRKGDPLSAAKATDQALLYNAKDKDLLVRKDSYYYSVTPEVLRARLEGAKGWFDVDYCLRKARSVLDAREVDLQLLDWAEHLATLATVVQLENRPAKVLLARARLRRGERDEAVTLLEEVRTPKPEKFAGGGDEEAWFESCKLLGNLYLDELDKPDLAVECFRAFRDSSKSGADTLYKLGRAYEQLGDRARAAKYYESVTAYESHPLAPDAREALNRVQAG